MCKYSDSTGYECPHKKLEDSDYCIFHLQDDNKDVDEFNKGIKDILETEEDLIHLHGFYFPPESSNFSGQIFQKKTNFDYAIFSGGANFKNAEFSGPTSFHHTIFSSRTSFKNAKFSGYATFNKAKFLEHTEFKKAMFSDACFSIAEFSENIIFGDATFSGEADFMKAKFSGFAGFWMTKFRNDAVFSRATFSGAVSFKTAIFSGSANFIFAEFSGKTSFLEAQFSGDVIFTCAELTRNFEFIPDKSGTIDFKNTYFSDNIRIKADLSKCSFDNSNIERVDMTDSTWIVDNKPKDSYKIWEERQGELTSNWKVLEGIYRRLKQSCQRFGDNDTAGKFYYREMECKRKKSGPYDKLWYKIFKISCGYGEKPENVILLSGCIILLSSLAFLYGGIELLGDGVSNSSVRLINYDRSSNLLWITTNFDTVFIDWLNCLYTSAITFTTLGYGDVRPIGYSRIVASVEAGFGIFMTSLFIFVFTRKMLR